MIILSFTGKHTLQASLIDNTTHTSDQLCSPILYIRSRFWQVAQEEAEPEPAEQARCLDTEGPLRYGLH